jgi:hypothetical protein
VLLYFNEHNLQDFAKIGILHLHGRPSLLCSPSAGGREYDRGYVMLSNVHAAAGNWDLSENVEQQRKERDVKKQPGHTCIKVNQWVHTFVVENQDHLRLL